MPSPSPFGRSRSRRLAAYLTNGAPAPDYHVAAQAVIVAEEEGFYTLYRVAVTASDGSRHRHLLIVPTNVSAASFDIGLALVEQDSVEADTGCLAGVQQIASALKWDRSRYRCFPPPAALNRFCL